MWAGKHFSWVVILSVIDTKQLSHVPAITLRNRLKEWKTARYKTHNCKEMKSLPKPQSQFSIQQKTPLFTGEQLLHTSLWYKTQLLSKCNLAEATTEAPTSLHMLRRSNNLCFIRRLLSQFWHSHGVSVTATLLWTVQAACERSVDFHYEWQWGWHPEMVHTTVKTPDAQRRVRMSGKKIFIKNMTLFGTLRIDPKLLT